MNFSRIIFDIETNGLLPEHVEPPFCMTKIHCIVIKCIDSGDILEFRNNENGNDLEEGVAVLEKADLIIGHNILDFDLPAIELIYPDFYTDARLIDTLVMVRMVFANQKEKDFRLTAAGKLPGRLIGRHGLESWGWRLGLHKGDYTKDRKEDLIRLHQEAGLESPTPEEIHAHTWGAWSEEMHDYCINDVAVNYLLWVRIESMEWNDFSTSFEHQIHLLMLQQERNGFLFDIPKAENLRDSLAAEYDKLSAEAIDQIGIWYKPTKISKEEPRAAYGEDMSRRTWGDVVIPKRNQNYAKSNAKFLATGEYTKLRHNKIEGCDYVPVIRKEFNPNSRPQIIDRLKTLYEWVPQDFTEKGNPEVNDEVLRNLAEHIPLAETLAESFYMKKRLGQVSDGKNGWLKLVRPDGRIHGRLNVGGTVSGRGTHSSPNMSQVQAITPIETKDRCEGEAIIDRHKKAGTYVSSNWNDKKGEWSILVRGREGRHGWDSRELFTVPKGYKLVGCDLSGIEFRCLANLTFPFDEGGMVDTVLNGDIHQMNADAVGIGRGLSKRLLYACVDMETEALTKAGWKHYNDLSVGDLVLTYNMEKDIQEWKPIQQLHYVPKAKRIRIEGRGIDVVCTPDHRWATNHKRMVNGEYIWERQFCRTDELTNAHRIIGNAPFNDDAGTGYTWYPDDGKYNGTWSTQIMNMAKNERGAFIAGFLNADGHFNKQGKWALTQKYGEHFDAMLAAMYLHFNTRISCYRHTSGNSVTAKAEVIKSREWGCQRFNIVNIPEGAVWCMTTENNSFVMRRGHFTTITGNCMYGGGDAKLGYIVEPLSSEPRQKTLGKQLRAKLMAAMPSLNKAIKEIKREKRKNFGTIRGLDGRRLYVRSDHSALNLRLQSDGAMIAKKWCLTVDDLFYEEGWDHGVDLDYAFCAWSHDEIQIAVKEKYAKRAAELMEAAAPIAGEFFHFKCPVTAESKIDSNWAQTH